MKLNKSSLNQAIYELIDLPDNAAIIDLGCRNAGYLNGIIEQFPNKVIKAIGVDISDKNFGAIPYSAPVELKVMNCQGKLQFDDNSFDLVLTKDLLECITDKANFVSEVNRILKPGGTIICVHADFDSVVYNGQNEELITKVIHAYAVTKQGWMDDLDGWMGRRVHGIFNNSGHFESQISVFSVVETEYKEGKFGYEFSKNIGWLVGESTDWVEGENTGVITKKEYNEFINNLIDADKNGNYLYSKPYYIYKGVKK
ncbi:MAG: methyltransferase domain-containing protein [Clostridia bacterium]|nr:methyltransferase domain-containing protein [Clostridia bacterium]